MSKHIFIMIYSMDLNMWACLIVLGTRLWYWFAKSNGKRHPKKVMSKLMIRWKMASNNFTPVVWSVFFSTWSSLRLAENMVNYLFGFEILQATSVMNFTQVRGKHATSSKEWSSTSRQVDEAEAEVTQDQRLQGVGSFNQPWDGWMVEKSQG